MKKFLIGLPMLAIAIASCTRTNTDEMPLVDESGKLITAPIERKCASEEVFERQLREDPSRAERMREIEAVTEEYARNPMTQGKLLANGDIQIPVVVNVVYRTTAENISDAQIASQIATLNKDYAGTNTDISKVPSIFTGVKAGDTRIRFVLDQVRRFKTTKTSFSSNDGVKKASGGGIAPLSPTTKLNIWTANLSGGLLGYAQFPGGSSATDGVVILYNAFGNTTFSPYNLGRTATHEVGHWLNLRHIWGDGACATDYVADTPTANAANTGCPAAGHKSTCSGTPVEMTMNYMDYTNDACMYMFTAGQKTRMNATFASGGGRNSFAQP